MQHESDTYRTAVAHAANLLGGVDQLAHRLQVSQDEVERWLAGESKPGMGTFLKVIDILLEEGPKPRFRASED